MIITVTPSPAVDKAIRIENFKLDTVNRVSSYKLDPGGKGINVSKVVKVLGGETTAMGIVGGENGKYIESKLTDSGIATEFTHTDTNTRTNIKIFDEVNNTYTDINEQGERVSSDTIDNLHNSLMAKVVENDIVVFAGRTAVGMADDTYSLWTKELSEKGVKVIADLDGNRLVEAVESKPYLIKPNEFELQEAYCLPNVDIDTLVKCAKTIVAKGVGIVVVSMGSRGAVYVSADQSLMVKGIKVNAISTVGAGDSITAAMAYGIERGMELEDMAKLAVATATAKVMCEGSSVPTYEAIQGYLGNVEVIKL